MATPFVRHPWPGDNRNLIEAIQLQKEAIFFIMLEGTRNDRLGENEVWFDYYITLERRISKNIKKLRHRMQDSEAMSSGRPHSDESSTK
jgi:hypothetical protein